MPLPNKKSQQYKKANSFFIFFNSKLCSPQTWHILPNPENSWSRRLSPNHILCQRPCPSKKVCDIDPKSLGQVIHPKDVLALLRRFENPNLHLTILQPEYSQFLPLTWWQFCKGGTVTESVGLSTPVWFPGHSRWAKLHPWPCPAALALGTRPLRVGSPTPRAAPLPGLDGWLQVTPSLPNPPYGKSQEHVVLQLQNGNS